MKQRTQAAESEVSFSDDLDGSSIRIGVLRTRWNDEHVSNLVDGIKVKYITVLFFDHSSLAFIAILNLIVLHNLYICVCGAHHIIFRRVAKNAR